MNHKAFYVFYIAFLVLILSLSSATSRTLSEDERPVYRSLQKPPICKGKTYGSCIGGKPIKKRPCRPGVINC